MDCFQDQRRQRQHTTEARAAIVFRDIAQQSHELFVVLGVRRVAGIARIQGGEAR